MPSPNTPAPLLSSLPQNSRSLPISLSSPPLSYHSPLKHCQDTNWGRSKVAVPEGEVDWSRNSAAEGDATSSSSSSSSARVTNERRDRDTRDRSPDSRERRDRDFGGGGERTHRDDRREDRGQRGGRGGKGGKGYRNPRDPRIDTAPPLSECKPIEHIANRWKPAYKNDGGAAGLDTLTQDEKLKRVHGILNKFTPEKFVRLSDQIVEMVTTQEALDDIIGCIVEKACHEQFFSELYAEMCVKLSQVPLPVALEDKAALFRRLLLNKCGTVFGEQSVAHAAAAAALTAAAATALAKPAAASLAEPAVTWLLHDRERLLWWRPHLHQERVRCRRQGARPVRPDRNHELGDHELVSARLPAHRVLPLRLGWQRLWLVLLKQQVHLRLHLALAAAFPGAVPRLVGRDVTATQQAS